MSTVYYSACHTCRVFGQLPKSPKPEEFHKEWVKRFRHEEHSTEYASEFDPGFDARINGKELGRYLGWGAYETKTVGKPYKDVSNETL